MESSCTRFKTNAQKNFPYEQYYMREKDGEKRKAGRGEHQWTGPKSIEWYTGSFHRDTMHGCGDYRWRYSGYQGLHSTYEGYFYSNDMHGYGIMSYPDGVVFTISSTEPDEAAINNTQYYYAWNNDDFLVDMMRHCYKHESQRKGEMSAVDILSILSGKRKAFKRPGKYEVDCRSLLMASYLGDVYNVTQLINNDDVYPGVTDSKGNSALMYATCGDQTEIIHFLVEAGANVDSFNDSCCTPLGLAILRFLYIQKDVMPSEMIQALIPPPKSPRATSPREQVSEWKIGREQIMAATAALTRANSKILKAGKKSALSLKDAPKKKHEPPKLPEVPEAVSAESVSENKNLYNMIYLEYISKINDLFIFPLPALPVSYIFEITDMTIGLDIDDEPKKTPDKSARKVMSKIIKQTTRPSKEAMWRSSEKDISSMESDEKQKVDLLSKIMFTILQLLSDGANPCLVRCPQSAVMMAVFAGCSDLVLQLMLHGADVNEKYPQMLDYTALDVAISQPLTYNNLDLVRTLLECGSDTNHRLRFKEQDEEIPGPTLLYVLLTRKIENDAEIEIQHQLLELLLQYRCDPMVQFKGRSPIDIALSKGASILDIFIENPGTNLNAVINDTNQTILVKIFSLPFFKTANASERLQTITNLLLFGADPLTECQNDQETFKNIFVFMKKTLFELENAHGKTNHPTASAKDQKGKPPKEKPRPERLSIKPTTRSIFDDLGDYRQAQELMTDCARMLFIRWLQAKLIKDLVNIINRFQHRHWNMILKEHKNKKPVGLWLTAERCLEVWDIIKTTRQKLYKNNRILKHLLCIVMFYNKRYKEQLKEKAPTAQIKNAIESDVTALLREYKSSDQLKEDMEQLKRPYVKPELTPNADKFNVCFECIIPHEEVQIKCKSCNQVAFCSMECMRLNSERPFCHPCGEYLKNKYFPAPDSSDDDPMNK